MECGFQFTSLLTRHTGAGAQVPEFNLEKPSAYNYDLALLGIITAAFGLIGLPPINGVLPQVWPTQTLLMNCHTASSIHNPCDV